VKPLGKKSCSESFPVIEDTYSHAANTGCIGSALLGQSSNVSVRRPLGQDL